MVECYQAASIVQHSLAHTQDFSSLKPFLWDDDQIFLNRLRTDSHFMYVYECMLCNNVPSVVCNDTVKAVLNAVTNRGVFVIEQIQLFRSFGGLLDASSERRIAWLMVKRVAVAAMTMMKHFADYAKVKPILQDVCNIFFEDENQRDDGEDGTTTNINAVSDYEDD
jgi:hypothetical protein